MTGAFAREQQLPAKMITGPTMMSFYGVLLLRARVQNLGASFASVRRTRPAAVHWRRTHNYYPELRRVLNQTQAEV